MGVYDEYIESFMNSFEDITNEKGLTTAKYARQPVESNDADISAMMDCAIKNMYSYSIFKAIFNFFKSKKTEQTMPCTIIFDMMNPNLATGLRNR